MTLSLMNIIVLFVLAVPMGYMVHISRRKKKKWIASAAIILYILVWVALKSYPLEASFATFQTPEQAAGYYNPNTEGVKYVLEGEETCLVILSKGKEDETINCLLRKTEDGYRYMSLARLKPISTQNGFVYWVKETGDYYLFAKTFWLDSVADKVELKGQDGDIIYYEVTRNNILPDQFGETSVTCYGYIHYSEDYVLTINGEEYSFAPLYSASLSEDA